MQTFPKTVKNFQNVMTIKKFSCSNCKKKKKNIYAVLVSYVYWRGAFNRQDQTITINMFIKLGVRSSVIPIMIDYLRNRKMKVKINGLES